MSFSAQYKAVKHSVVQVYTWDRKGAKAKFASGSVIGPEGRHVLTCAHCVDLSESGIVSSWNNGEDISQAITLPAEKGFSWAPAWDIAILEFKERVGKPVTFANSEDCEVGDVSFVVGHPMRVQEQTLTSAYIATISAKFLRLDASINKGNSGGPLFNADGQQLGVINQRLGGFSEYLQDVKESTPAASINVSGVDPVETLQKFIEEMDDQLNLGIGYAIPTSVIRELDPLLKQWIPEVSA